MSFWFAEQMMIEVLMRSIEVLPWRSLLKPSVLPLAANGPLPRFDGETHKFKIQIKYSAVPNSSMLVV